MSTHNRARQPETMGEQSKINSRGNKYRSAERKHYF
jgi:hypothetical protein